MWCQHRGWFIILSVSKGNLKGKVYIMLEVEEFKAAVPKHLRSSVSDELVKHVNNLMFQDPDQGEYYKDNIITYANVLQEGKYKVQDYLAACMYVSFRNMGYTKQESWQKTFPSRYKAAVAKGRSVKAISASVSAYDKGSLVQKVYARSLVRVNILYRDVQYRMIENLTNMALDEDINPRERVAASTSLLNHLKDPEENKIELDVSIKEDSIIDGLKGALKSLAKEKATQIEQGTLSSRESAQTGIVYDVDGEVVDD